MEKAALQQVVASYTGSRAELAARLGISDRSLYRKIKALNKQRIPHDHKNDS